jgi:hypothetical protein
VAWGGAHFHLRTQLYLKDLGTSTSLPLLDTPWHGWSMVGPGPNWEGFPGIFPKLEKDHPRFYTLKRVVDQDTAPPWLPLCLALG